MEDSQNKLILEFLKKGKTINPILALKKFGCFRLSARIFNLREQGHDIECNIVKVDNKKFASYKYLGQK
jgi:hypothetical protein